jgi:hypothetical protein
MTEQNENTTLPAKTCSIERLITVPADIEKVINGQKTATRRNGRYADVGEIMTLQDRQFVVEKVYTQTLGDLTDEICRQEGYSGLEAYKQSILSMHAGMPWLPHMKVWVHEFRPVQD